MTTVAEEIEDRLRIETFLARNCPELLHLFEAEALADGRFRADVSEAARLPMIRDRLRIVIRRLDGGREEFRNPLYPLPRILR